MSQVIFSCAIFTLGLHVLFGNPNISPSTQLQFLFKSAESNVKSKPTLHVN